MSILEKAKIGNSVKVNLKLSKDRLPKEVVDRLRKMASKEREMRGF